MPKRSRTTKRPVKKTTKPRRPKSDPVAAAADALRAIIERAEIQGKNPMAVALGRLGGLKGGHARAAKLTETERTASASAAARARWAKRERRP